LIQATDGNLYGETGAGGSSGDGTLFQLTPAGALATLYNFETPSFGNIQDALVQSTNGDFYGMTFGGGIVDSALCFWNGNTCGAVFRFSLGLSPFVKILPASGGPYSVVNILGTDLEGATSGTLKSSSKFVVAGFSKQ